MISHMKCRPAEERLLHWLLRKNFQKCEEKEAHIQESRILKNKLSFKHIFNPCRSTFRMRYHFISDETCGGHFKNSVKNRFLTKHIF